MEHAVLISGTGVRTQKNLQVTREPPSSPPGLKCVFVVAYSPLPREQTVSRQPFITAQRRRG